MKNRYCIYCSDIVFTQRQSNKNVFIYLSKESIWKFFDWRTRLFLLQYLKLFSPGTIDWNATLWPHVVEESIPIYWEDICFVWCRTRYFFLSVHIIFWLGDRFLIHYNLSKCSICHCLRIKTIVFVQKENWVVS